MDDSVFTPRLRAFSLPFSSIIAISPDEEISFFPGGSAQERQARFRVTLFRLLVPPRERALSDEKKRGEKRREREKKGILFSFSGRSRRASPAGSELPAGYTAN